LVLFARDIVERDFISLEPDTTVREASKIMKDRRHGFVITSRPDGSPGGVVTEWDILAKVVAEGKDPSKVKLREIMTSEVVSVNSGEGIAQVAQLMTDRGIRRVVVIDHGEVIGVITARTILARLKEYVDKVSSQISRLQAPWF
jgi:CBS domain-containing protein